MTVRIINTGADYSATGIFTRSVFPRTFETGRLFAAYFLGTDYPRDPVADYSGAGRDLTPVGSVPSARLAEDGDGYATLTGETDKYLCPFSGDDVCAVIDPDTEAAYGALTFGVIFKAAQDQSLYLVSNFVNGATRWAGLRAPTSQRAAAYANPGSGNTISNMPITGDARGDIFQTVHARIERTALRSIERLPGGTVTTWRGPAAIADHDPGGANDFIIGGTIAGSQGTGVAQVAAAFFYSGALELADLNAIRDAVVPFLAARGVAA